MPFTSDGVSASHRSAAARARRRYFARLRFVMRPIFLFILPFQPSDDALQAFYRDAVARGPRLLLDALLHDALELDVRDGTRAAVVGHDRWSRTSVRVTSPM
jgi:hypothetical protein